MRFFLSSAFIFCAFAAHASDVVTKDEAREEADGLFEHIEFVSQYGLKIKNGQVTEEDSSRLLQSGSALLGAAIQYQERRVRDLAAVAGTHSDVGSEMDRYSSCTLAATYLAEHAIQLSKPSAPQFGREADFKQYRHHFFICGRVLHKFSISGGGKRF